MRTKNLLLGWGKDGKVFVTVQIKSARGGETLSIRGVVGPMSNGHAKGACGQIQDYLTNGWTITDYAKGWSPESVERLQEIWNQHHLNDLTAGSPAQEACLAKRPDLKTYEERCEYLTSQNLNPDPDFSHPDKNGERYRYGSEWLHTDLPDSVMDWFESLTETKVPNPWGTA